MLAFISDQWDYEGMISQEHELVQSSDQLHQIAQTFLHDMETVSAALAATTGSVSELGAISRDYERVKSLRSKLAGITYHPILGATVRISPVMKSYGNDDAIRSWFPWHNNEFMGDEPIEGVIEDIYPGAGIFVTRGADPHDSRFVKIISDIDLLPTAELEILELATPSVLPEVKK